MKSVLSFQDLREKNQFFSNLGRFWKIPQIKVFVRLIQMFTSSGKLFTEEEPQKKQRKRKDEPSVYLN